MVYTLRVHTIAISLLLFALMPSMADPGLSFEAFFLGGPTMTRQPGYAAAPGTSIEGRLGMATGEYLGLVVEAGMSCQSPSSFTSDWFRYRGFTGFTLGAGAHIERGLVDASLVAGGMLARYDASYSYMWFPYIEAGLSLPVARLGKHFLLEAGLSLPIYLRADAFSVALRALVSLAFLVPRKTDSGPAQ